MPFTFVSTLCSCSRCAASRAELSRSNSACTRLISSPCFSTSRSFSRRNSASAAATCWAAFAFSACSSSLSISAISLRSLATSVVCSCSSLKLVASTPASASRFSSAFLSTATSCTCSCCSRDTSSFTRRPRNSRTSPRLQSSASSASGRPLAPSLAARRSSPIRSSQLLAARCISASCCLAASRICRFSSATSSWWAFASDALSCSRQCCSSSACAMRSARFSSSQCRRAPSIASWCCTLSAAISCSSWAAISFSKSVLFHECARACCWYLRSRSVCFWSCSRWRRCRSASSRPLHVSSSRRISSWCFVCWFSRSTATALFNAAVASSRGMLSSRRSLRATTSCRSVSCTCACRHCASSMCWCSLCTSASWACWQR
uniref:Uncharacterized protein n=1 Tax=Ixodes ricinus TaxID=34613 RepID=A0A147BE71_IXORI